MKKGYFIFILLMLMLISGCSFRNDPQKETTLKKEKIDVISKSYVDEVKHINNYIEKNNMIFNFDTLWVDFPKVNSVSSFNESSKILSRQENYDIAVEYVRKLGLENNYDPHKDIYFYDTDGLYTSEDDCYNEDSRYVLYEHLDLPTTRLIIEIYIKDYCTIQLNNGKLYAYGINTVANYCKDQNQNFSSYLQLVRYETGKEAIYDLKDIYSSNKTDVLDHEYELIDKKMSVKEVIEFVLKNYRNYLVDDNSEYLDKIEFIVDKVSVIKIQDKYAYCLDLNFRYKDVEIIEDKMTGSVLSQFETLNIAQVYVAASDEITSIYPNHEIQLQVEKEIDEIWNLESAIELVSSKLSENIKYEVEYVIFGYVTVRENDVQHYIPGWYFYGVNSTQNLAFEAFVESTSDEVYLNVGERDKI